MIDLIKLAKSRQDRLSTEMARMELFLITAESLIDEESKNNPLRPGDMPSVKAASFTKDVSGVDADLAAAMALSRDQRRS